MIKQLWERILQRVRPLFWPVEAPNHDYIARYKKGRLVGGMLLECPMPWPDNAAVCNKRAFVWRFAYWVRYLKPDKSNAHAYWELVKDSNDPAFWRAASSRLKVSTILYCLLKDKKLPTQ